MVVGINYVIKALMLEQQINANPRRLFYALN